MTCRSIEASSPSMPRLLIAADLRVRPAVAVRGGGCRQEKCRKLRSPTSPCTAGRGVMQMAVFDRFRRVLSVIPGDQRLVLDGTRACGSSGLAGGQGDVRGAQ